MKTILSLSLVAALAAPSHAGSRDLVDTAVQAGSFKTLAAALEAAGLVDALRGDGPFTVFAPTDAAFEKLPEGAVADLLKPENRERLQEVLKFHVVSGRVPALAAIRAGSAATLAGPKVAIGLRDGRLTVNGAAIVKTDIAASNGVIHVIDSVLLPPAPQDPTRALLELAIERGVPLFNAGQTRACADIYEIAARAALDLGRLEKRERRSLKNALRSLPHSRDAAARAWLLRNAFDKILAKPAPEPRETSMNKETFQPLIEAPLPEGYPRPGPLGEMVLKQYPAYRAARTRGGNAFWTLFRHIKKNDIAMTAPVEMGMDGANDMAFLYADPELGEAGRDGAVEVVDLDPVRVLSVGIRGPMAPEKIDAAKKAIENRLARGDWKRAGEWRLLGYNSPMVPADRRFWEVQIPVAPTTQG